MSYKKEVGDDDDDDDGGNDDEDDATVAAASAAEEELSRKFKYATLCEYLDRMQRIRWNDKFGKQRVLNALMAKWSAEAGSNESTPSAAVSFYPVLRIMANSLDERKFNMKSVSFEAKSFW
ncbi:unnamed protein product [Gongylonema pulchrum]|uniref:TFIIS central domain-containing protein n=1 Tax=Gongylonema pulchrum TaxID=637853 RepID=A0A183EJK6_9BILA|nr:unnamed protein product [Gongylonema pulchrum]